MIQADLLTAALDKAEQDWLAVERGDKEAADVPLCPFHAHLKCKNKACDFTSRYFREDCAAMLQIVEDARKNVDTIAATQTCYSD